MSSGESTLESKQNIATPPQVWEQRTILTGAEVKRREVHLSICLSERYVYSTATSFTILIVFRLRAPYGFQMAQTRCTAYKICIYGRHTARLCKLDFHRRKCWCWRDSSSHSFHDQYHDEFGTDTASLSEHLGSYSTLCTVVATVSRGSREKPHVVSGCSMEGRHQLIQGVSWVTVRPAV